MKMSRGKAVARKHRGNKARGR